MAKENTHCKFSLNILESKVLDKNIKHILEKNRLVYLYGSAFPDSLYYTKEVEQVSIQFHSKEINYQELIVDFLKKRREEKELAFLLGVISHIFLDLNLHPNINKECNYDECCHFQIETEFDRVYSKNWSFFNRANQKALEKELPFTIAEDFLQKKLIPLKTIIRHHFFYNRIFKNKLIGKFYQLLFKNNSKRSLFYTQKNFQYTHESRVKIVRQAEKGLVEIFNNFFDFQSQKISKEQFFTLFPKGSLDGD